MTPETLHYPEAASTRLESSESACATIDDMKQNQFDEIWENILNMRSEQDKKVGS